MTLLFYNYFLLTALLLHIFRNHSSMVDLYQLLHEAEQTQHMTIGGL